jgi:SAM-dependent methyltransferase
MKPLWHLDEPTLITPRSRADRFRIAGWIASLQPVSDVVVLAKDEAGRPLMEIELRQRPDVAPVLGIPGLRAIGFEAQCPLSDVAGHEAVQVGFAHEQQSYAFWAPVRDGPPDTIDNKARKLSRMLPLLQCPRCGARDLVSAPARLTCEGCGATYGSSERHFDFLPDDFRHDFAITDTDNVSENPYDGEIVSIINRHHRGWVLDCGAGRRQHYYEHVVNFEVVPYETTDVMGVGERLPFRDEAFDAVFSIAVLEHVRDPLAAAREIQRVLKPGGTLYCQLPFLQPFHGYPHHYFNATQSGLLRLFEDIDVETIDVLDFGQPVAALSWSLQTYVEGLPADERERFMDMTVRDFLRPTREVLTEPFVLQLSEEAKRTLACCNVLIGTKPRRDDIKGG